MFRHASFNRSYALAWNEKSQSYVPAPEATRARGKRGSTVLAAAMVSLVASGAALAADPVVLPTGGRVTLGQASISQTGSTTTIQQSTGKAAIDWQSFGIGANGTVNFLQPSSGSIALNRVVGQDPSRILGSLNANGQVFIVNPNGVLFAPSAQVSAAGVLASTRDLSNADFAAGHYRFSGSGTGAVVNQGSLRAHDEGYVVLVGAQVVNEGRIDARLGDARLAAADDVTIKLDGAHLTGLTVSRGTLDALAANHGLIRADGGRIFLTADGMDALAQAAVNNTGVLEARAVENHGGVIRLLGDARVGHVTVGGTVDASAASGQGGRVVATAHDVVMVNGATIDATGATAGGTVLLGGGWQGKDSSVANASTVAMEPGARIDVSSTGQGAGGTAVLWSQDHTAFGGTIAARGGARGGDGGQVETSSHAHLQAVGQVDAAATHGANGQWLLDPNNVTIASSGASGTTYSATYNPAGDSVILASNIVTSLNNGTNVTITTGSTGTSAGDITVNAPIAVTGFYSPTLTLSAANDVNLNAAVSNSTTYNSRLNVVFTADADASGAGNVNFGSAGRVTTTGGNFYAGQMSGDALARKGQNLTMAAGSAIDVGGGMLDIMVNGAVTLSGNSLTNNGGSAYYNSGGNSLLGSYIGIAGSSIASANTNPATPDILSKVQTTLNAGSIGSAPNPVKISAGTSRAFATLNVANAGGDSYVNEIGKQAFSTISVAIGSQIDSTQNLQIMGDAGGDGSTGTGHLLLKTDATGVLNVALGQVKTAGVTGANAVDATNVAISAPNMTFADNSVNTGTSSFSASGGTIQGVALANDTRDIVSPNITLSASTIGTATNPVELSSGASTTGSLIVVNGGGSTFLKSVDDNFTTVSMSHVKDVGSHSVLFSGGDHLDFATDGNGVSLPTISGGASDGRSFGNTTGIDATRRNRSVTVTALTGDIVFGDASVNTGGGAFNAVIARSNTTGDMAALNAYDAMAPVAQITAGNVSLSVQNDPTPAASTIGAAGHDIQIAQGAGAANNTLSVSTQQGGVNVHELTQNHFKTIDLSLGSASAAQAVAIDLTGPDDIAFADSGSLLSVDASKVNLSSNNRNFSLSAGSRSIQEDGVSPGSGNYSLSAGQLLKLNGDVITNGGNVSLTGAAGVDLLAAVRVDSNVDRLGNSGSITVNASTSSVSSTGGTRSLIADSSSADGTAGSINLPSDANSRAGAYLTGLTLNAAGVDPSRDGAVSIGGSNYLLNGSFSATGNTTLSNNSSLLIDTEQGNLASAGSITFAGADLRSYAYNGMTSFNAATTQATSNGGNVSLATRNRGGLALTLAGITVNASGGSSGAKGDITLPQVATTLLYGGPVTQSYTGRILTLNGNLTSEQGAIALSGDVRLASSVTIDSNLSQIGNSGAVTFTGTGVSATGTAKNLAIDTSSGSGSGGAVSLPGGTNAGGAYVNNLSVATARGGGIGTNGAIALASIDTEGSQTYSGGSASLSGGLTTNGGNIALGGLAGLTLSGSTITIKTDRAGGSNAAGALTLGSLNLNGGNFLTIDTTADGGGAGADLTLNGAGDNQWFSTVNIAAKSIVTTGVVRASETVTMEARGATADLTLNGRVQTMDDEIVLAAGRNFVNNNASNTGIQAGYRYFVYSANPAASLEGMTGYSKHYNQTYTAGSVPAYAETGNNWFFYSVAPVISVASGVSPITYGTADPTLTLAAGNYSGFIDGDTRASLSGTQTLSLASAGALSGSGHRKVGSYAIALNGSLTDSLGYQYAAYNESLVVSARTLAVAGVAAAQKVYDGNTGANLTGTATLAGTALVGDVVALDATAAAAAFADKNVGSGKAVTASGYAVNGADAGNYVLAQPTGLSADITPKALSVSGSTVTTKTYDGNGTAAATAGTLTGLVGSETVSASASGVFADRNAGTGKNATVGYLLANGANGGLAGNYSLAGEVLTGDITPKGITVAATGDNKVYDGTTAATTTLASTGLLGDDIVSFSGSAALADKNAGTGKAVNVSGIVAGGLDAGNYSFNATAATTANVSARAITVTAAGIDKVYDGSMAASATLASAGVIDGDVVSFSGNATLANKNVGSGKSVSVAAIGAGGTDGGNYSVNATATTTANITAKALAVAAIGVDKVYDATTAATATLVIAGVVDGDTVAFTGNATLADKNVGNGKAVNVSAIAASGLDAGNYSFATTAATTANVTPKAITVAATGIDKVYDGSAAAAATLASAGVIGDDVVNFSGTATLADKNVGTAKAVTVAAISATGIDAGNYGFGATAATTASVTAKAITVTATGVDKVYDGTTAATALLASQGVVEGDTVGFAGHAVLADKNAGTGKAVGVNQIGASGADAGNYSFAGTAATTANVTPKAITVAATGVDKVYDGSTAISATLAGAGVLGEDVVTFTGNALLADKNAGIGKVVNVAGIAAGGIDAANYSFDTAAATTANVAAKAITVTATGIDKVYDGSTAASVVLASVGVIEGDTVTFGGHALLADKNVGTGKAVTVGAIAGTGADAGNYSFVGTAVTSADVTAKTITVAATGVDKVYDGTRAATALLTSADVIADDAIGFTGIASLLDKNAGNHKPVNVTGLAAQGADAGNYRLASDTAATTANVSPRSIAIVATSAGKVYDGTLAVDISAGSNDLITGDSVSIGGRGLLLDRNAGAAKPVQVLDLVATGADAANYSFQPTGTTTASVTPQPLGAALQGAVVKVDDGKTDAALTSANFALSGVVAGDAITVSQSLGQFADTLVGSGKTVSATLAGASYVAGADTLLGNYVLFTGQLAGPVGSILDAVSSSPAYIGAVASATASVEALSPPGARKTAETTVVGTNTRETLSFRRTFTIGDGGIRLPAGVGGSNKDATE